MRLELTGRHITITATIRALVEERLAPMLRMLNDSAVSAQVVLTKEKTRVRAEITLHARGEHFLHGEATGRDVQTALGAAVDKVDRQVQRLKSKWSKGKRQGISAAKAASAAPRPERGGKGFSSARGRPPAARMRRGPPAAAIGGRERASSHHPRAALRGEADVGRRSGARSRRRRRRVPRLPQRRRPTRSTCCSAGRTATSG